MAHLRSSIVLGLSGQRTDRIETQESKEGVGGAPQDSCKTVVLEAKTMENSQDMKNGWFSFLDNHG